MKIIDGKLIANEILEDIKEKVASLKKEGNIPHLAIILVGNNPSSEIYVKNKIKKCEEVGIETSLLRFDENVEESTLVQEINRLNNDSKVKGILLQSPLPSNLDEKKLMQLISYKKDVDGFTHENLGALLSNDEKIISATPLGIIKLLESENISVASKNVVIVGRSNIVGRPLAMVLLNRDATVTIAHSKTSNLKSICRNADILIVAIGKANFITDEYVKEGSIVIDVGINRIDGKITGDVDFEKVKAKVSYITPVPGGVGPMTISSLLCNLITLMEIEK